MTNMEQVEFELVKRCLIIRLNGDLDHHLAALLREDSDRLIESENVKHVIFDLNDVSFMDSSGIGVIMGRYRKVIFMGGKVAVVGVVKSVDRIFKMSGLYKIIHKFGKVEEAVVGLYDTDKASTKG